jgi:hypothetical protein
MQIFLLTVGAIAVAMAAMAVGVAITGRRLKGSCGGSGEACECARSGVPMDQRSCGKV